MKSLATKAQERAATRHDHLRLTHAEQLVATLTHMYIHLGMKEAHAYRSALADFEPDYPGEIAHLRMLL